MNNEKFNILDPLIFYHAESANHVKMAIVDGNRTCTYGELSRYVRSFVSITGIEEKYLSEPIIACLFDDSVESTICFFGLIHNGIIPCYLSPNMPLDAYEFYLQSIDIRYVLLSESYSNKFINLFRKLGIEYKIVKNDIFSPEIKSIEYSARREFTEESPLFCAYTAGTTGHPSAVLHRHKDIKIMNETYVRHVLRVKQEDVLYATSKMCFSYGLNCLFIALYNGAAVILSKSQVTEDNILEVFDRYKPTILFSVPFVYKKLLSYARVYKNMYMPKICVSAGERLGKEVFEEWKEKFYVEILDSIDSTETLSAFISNFPDGCKKGSVGKLVPGFQYDIKDFNGNSVEENQHGILWIKGETYHNAYLNNAAATKERFREGWFVTNDIFCQDSDGYFYYKCRLDDMICKNGVWIFPTQIEDRINKNSGVCESVVLGYKADNIGTLIIAMVEIENGFNLKKISKDIFKAHGEEVFYKEEEINVVCFVERIPRTCNGKIKRNAIVEMKEFIDLTSVIKQYGAGIAFDSRRGVVMHIKAAEYYDIIGLWQHDV